MSGTSTPYSHIEIKMTLTQFVRPMLLCIGLAGTFAGRSSTLAAQQAVSWNHADECTASTSSDDAKCTPVRSVTAESGEKITLMISKTCPDDFEYTVIPIPVAKTGTPQSAANITACTGSKAIDIVHDSRYGGYIITIVKKDGAKNNAGNARVTIAVKTSQWVLGFYGGFTANGLVNPPYTLREEQTTVGSTTTTKYRIIDDTTREDDVARSVVSFVHLTHSRWEIKGIGVGLTFGLGIEPDRTQDYYPGISLMFGDRAAITIGRVIGQINALPAGRQLNDLVTDANTLSTLGHQRVNRWFGGISYRFLGNSGSELKKPFQGESPAGGVATGGATGDGKVDANKPTITKEEDDQTVAADVASKPLKITVVSNGKPLVNAQVTWASDPSAGVVFSKKIGATDDKGVAETTVTVSKDVTPGTIKVVAKLQGAEATFTVTVKK